MHFTASVTTAFAPLNLRCRLPPTSHSYCRHQICLDLSPLLYFLSPFSTTTTRATTCSSPLPLSMHLPADVSIAGASESTSEGGCQGWPQWQGRRSQEIVIVVPKTNYGDIEFGFFPHVVPETVQHIFKLVRLGCYNTNHFFRVDKGFAAQVADVMGGRTAPMNEEQRREAEKTIVGEFDSAKHVRGILSMGRVTKGDDTLRKLEQLPTRRQGIFVMPIERITILSTNYYDTEEESCEREISTLRRLSESTSEAERWRRKCLPQFQSYARSGDLLVY